MTAKLSTTSMLYQRKATYVPNLWHSVLRFSTFVVLSFQHFDISPHQLQFFFSSLFDSGTLSCATQSKVRLYAVSVSAELDSTLCLSALSLYISVVLVTSQHRVQLRTDITAQIHLCVDLYEH